MPLLDNATNLRYNGMEATAVYLNNILIWSSSTLVSSGLTLKLDAADISSYPGSGDTWTDLAGTQQNITLVNAPTFTSEIPSYFTFNGVNQYGVGTGAVVPQLAYSKCVWFYLDSYATNNNLVSGYVGGHFMYLSGTNRVYSGHANWGNYAAYPSTSTFSLNQWYNVVLTFNTSEGMTLYVNGVQDSTYTANKTQHTGDESTEIASFAGDNLLSGRIAKVYCYNRSLTAVEVLQNYNADKSKFGL